MTQPGNTAKARFAPVQEPNAAGVVRTRVRSCFELCVHDTVKPTSELLYFFSISEKKKLFPFDACFSVPSRDLACYLPSRSRGIGKQTAVSYSLSWLLVEVTNSLKKTNKVPHTIVSLLNMNHPSNSRSTADYDAADSVSEAVGKQAGDVIIHNLHLATLELPDLKQADLVLLWVLERSHSGKRK